MLRIRKYGLPIVLLVVAALTGTACKPSVEQLNNKGNDRFAEEAYLEALAAYQSAQLESPEMAEPYYNAANALYRKGAYDEALAQMEQALQFAQFDENVVQSLAEKGLYNLGNTSYNQESWEAAIAAYREALLRNPDDQDAKYNLELALQQLQQQQEQQNQEQEQQDEEQEQKQDADQDKEQSEDGEGQENEQEQPQDQSQDGKNSEEENDQEDSESNPGNEGEQEQQEQNQDQQNQSPNGQEEGEEGTSPSTVPPSGQGMTAEQAEQLLAAIASESETLQEILGQIFVVPSLPPVQDW